VKQKLEEEHAASGRGPPQSRGEDKDELTVEIRYKGVEKKFSGNAESIWLSLSRFFNQFLPSFEVAQNLMLNVDLQKLAKDSEGIIGFAKEGPCLLVPRNKLTDNETLSLLLLARHLAHLLGNAETDAVSKEELQGKLGKDAKTVSTRLGELVKNQLVTKTTHEKYRITTFGLMQMQKDIIPKIKTKRGL
jgi:DNA-binding MarR family transcriptional regulator